VGGQLLARRDISLQHGASVAFRREATIFLPMVGCAVGPDFVAPLAPVADKYRNASSRATTAGLSRWLVPHQLIKHEAATLRQSLSYAALSFS
jgi:hypothetical protein